MCEGICDHCREKVQWRFKFNKYKPLTKPGNCQRCKNKTITKAYRSLCDGCATPKKECAACCGDILTLNAVRRAELAARGKLKEEGVGGEEEEVEDTKGAALKPSARSGGASGAASASASASGASADDGAESEGDGEEGDYSDEEDEEDEEGEEGEEDEDDEEEDSGEDDGAVSAKDSVGTNEVDLAATVLPVHSVFHISKREMRQFEEIGVSKYSKSRVVGSAEDRALVEDLHKHGN
jgi:hypothetical protein